MHLQYDIHKQKLGRFNTKMGPEFEIIQVDVYNILLHLVIL